ncbi:transcription factor TFIIIB subunit brf1 [Ceratocystis pirilliformis]|uniref:Transcription factor TFIIIB subunit brf1 n=1 Tax=Ceratocystis pirilliformis TaxID=259994 RepID=A0ABR3ZEH7_9PEZI
MSSFLTPMKRAPMPGGAAQPIRPRAIQRPNLVRAMRENDQRRYALTTAAAAAAASTAVKPSISTSGRTQCPNKSCPKSDVVEGICRSCGRVVDDSNIVSEVQFGETSSGAAMVQGSFIGPDQGGVRSLGPNFRRVGGSSEDREKTIRDAKMFIAGFAHQLELSESLINSAVQAFKLASNANFIQGRSLAGVAAVCLYVACRNEPPCKIMLLDLADLVQINVFKLGRTFKAFNKAIPICNGGFDPVYPEDLIYRFATKLEFNTMTSKVAEDAVRLVRRMSRDWMVMGRRPSGICGACLLMAARMNNFRRTVREVVYIVKVTNHTIQNRLEEFKVTESSNMTVEDFLSQDLLESSHDPPSFYKNAAEYQAKLKERIRKRKRRITDELGPERQALPALPPSPPTPSATISSSSNTPSLTTTAATAAAPASLPIDPAMMPNPTPPEPAEQPPRLDADGFAVPQIPTANGDINAMALADPEGEAALSDLARNFGDQPARQTADRSTEQDDGNDEDNDNDNDNDNGESQDGKAPSGDVGLGLTKDGKPRKRAPKSVGPKIPLDPEWEADELDLEAQISEIFNDPHTTEHAKAFETAQKRAQQHSQWALSQEPKKEVSMAAEVCEDEFANDPEVSCCLLSEEEVRIKELVWSNHNKDWLRTQQEKVFRLKLAADKPKQTRRRKKRPRMGEGQAEPADTPADAAVSVMKERAISKRINYDAIRSLFDIGEEDTQTGASSTRPATSYAGSAAGEEEPDQDEAEGGAEDGYDDMDGDGPGSPVGSDVYGYGDDDGDDYGYDEE